MGRGFGDVQQSILQALAAYPRHLIATEVLVWWYHDGEHDSYAASLAAFNALPVGADLPWTREQEINFRRSLRNLHGKGLIKSWGRDSIAMLNGQEYGNLRRQILWSMPNCEGAKHRGYVLAYQPKASAAAAV
jgi:hypothetical protein